MKYIIFYSVFISILFSINLTSCFSQCSDRTVFDFSEGKVSTHRMWFPINLQDYQYYINTWESQANKWINQGDFKENEINIFKKDIKDNSPQYKLESCYNILHSNKNENRYNALYDIFRQKQDTLPYLILNYLINDSSSIIRTECAQFLKYYSGHESYELLKILANDKCKFVQLEAALSLSYIGEKSISFKVLSKIWEENDSIINLDNYPYFTTGMRNIGDENAISFLSKLLLSKNLYCVLDASICLLQLKQKDQCLKGINRVLMNNCNTFIFYIGTMVLYEYFPSKIVVTELKPFLQSSNKDKVGFTNFILKKLLNQ